MSEFAISSAIVANIGASADAQVREAERALDFALDDASLLVVAGSQNHDPAELAAALKRSAPHAQIHGMTSCLGAMSHETVVLDGDAPLAIWALRDAYGSYGTAAVAADGQPQEAARQAVLSAIARAGRDGELPEAIWLNATPGAEEAIVAGIQSVVGHDVPILGGSAADNSVSGDWFVFDNQQIVRDGVALAVLFPSVEIGHSFHSGYAPSGPNGRVTKAEGRRLIEIDGVAAAAVYNDWSGGAIDPVMGAGGDALMLSSLHPIGRKQGGKGYDGRDDYLLSHPAKIHADGSIDLFTEVAEGELLEAMSGTPDNLAVRAGRVAVNAQRSADIDSDQLSGALVIYCAGCMLTIQDRMGEVAESLNQVLDGKPYAGLFTFGEQGCFPDGESRHGNLMISALVFGS